MLSIAHIHISTSITITITHISNNKQTNKHNHKHNTTITLLFYYGWNLVDPLHRGRLSSGVRSTRFSPCQCPSQFPSEMRRLRRSGLADSDRDRRRASDAAVGDCINASAILVPRRRLVSVSVASDVATRDSVVVSRGVDGDDRGVGVWLRLWLLDTLPGRRERGRRVRRRDRDRPRR